jgi:hypothetical protein
VDKTSLEVLDMLSTGIEGRGMTVSRAIAVAVVLVVTATVGSSASAGPSWSLVGTNAVASSPVQGGGYPVPPGRTKPDPGTCRLGDYNANRSESWIAVEPGTEDLVGSSKFFFEKFSTFYIFHLGSYRIVGGAPVDNNQVPGYDCVSTGTQDMPPSWTDNTDPNVDFDTKGRVYQITLPFNAFWEGGLHPDAEIDVSYSDDLGKTWVKGNGGKALEPPNNQTSLAFGHVEDKQWVAVNHIPGNANQDHVYAAWAVFNGSAIKVRVAVSRDRGQTFAKPVNLSPSQISSGATYVYPSVDAAGDVYVAVVSFPPNGKTSQILVARSTDDGRSFGPFVSAATPGLIPTAGLPNTRFRDGIVESFAASPTYPGHLYLAYEDWDGTQMDVKLTQSTDGGATWSAPATVNDNVDPAGTPTDQFQPSVAAGPGGAVAVAFYDRREPCPSDSSILPADQGRTNFCIDTSLQAYKDTGSGAVPVGDNVRMSEFTWDPEQPGQHVDELSQYPCAGHRDPCPNGRGFIGDYFGLAISSGNIYGLFVSTHYPSSVTADEGGFVYYQQQVLAKVPRSTFGGGY